MIAHARLGRTKSDSRANKELADAEGAVMEGEAALRARDWRKAERAFRRAESIARDLD